jgi:uncharacterized repeat protein (TIGR01451 family)
LVVAPPFVDSVPSNNTATDQDQIMESADISVSVSDGRQYVQVGNELDYLILVRNAGPDDAQVFVSDTLPAGLDSAFWECSASAGATCSPGSGTFLSDLAFLPAGGQITYVYSARIGPANYTAPIANTAAAFGHLELVDPQGNNFGTDTPADIVVLFRNGFDSN